MTLPSKYREILYSVATVAVLTLLGGALAIFAASVKLKLLLVSLGGISCVLGAALSRNPRLFLLWGLGFSIPFMFARTFGQVLTKGGGEIAFNLDVTDVCLFFLCLYLARDFYQGRRRYLRVPKAAYWWITIMLFGLYAIIAGPYRTTAAHETFRMAKMLVFFLALCQELETPRRILHWCGGLTLGLIVNSIAGLIQYFYHTTLGLVDLGEPTAKVTKTLAATSLNGVEVWRVGAFVIHPNVFGIFLAAVLPLTVCFFVLRIGTAFRIYFLIASILGFLALIATESRSGWVGFGAALCCMVILLVGHSGLRRRTMFAIALMGIVLTGIVVAERGPILRRIFDSKEAALRFRGVFNDDAKKMIAEKPLWGYGLNSYVLNIPLFATYDYGNWPPPVHQIYYLWWAETGTIGLLVHLALWGGLIWQGIRNLAVKNRRMFGVNAACLAGLLAFTLDGFVSFSPRITPTLKTMWALGAMIMAVHYWRLRVEVYGATRPTLEPPAPALADALEPSIHP